MATNRAEKEEQLTMLKDSFGRMKAAVFAGYRGMTVASVSKLRKMLRDQNMDYKVAKKNLMRMAAQDAKVAGFSEAGFDGPTAVVMSFDDEIAAARTVKNFTKEDPNLTIFAGIMNGKMLSRDQVIALASLPGMEQLRAQLLGTMMGPVGGFLRTANGPLTGFVRILGQLAKKAA